MLRPVSLWHGALSRTGGPMRYLAAALAGSLLTIATIYAALVVKLKTAWR